MFVITSWKKNLNKILGPYISAFKLLENLEVNNVEDLFKIFTKYILLTESTFRLQIHVSISVYE
jgi:hypothetical protein